MASKKAPPPAPPPAAAKRRPKQTFIPGTEPKSVPDIDDVAERLYETRKERMELSRKEGELVAKLVVLLKQHKLRVYKNDELEVELRVVEEKVRVKRKADETGDDD